MDTLESEVALLEKESSTKKERYDRKLHLENHPADTTEADEGLLTKSVESFEKDYYKAKKRVLRTSKHTKLKVVALVTPKK